MGIEVDSDRLAGIASDLRGGTDSLNAVARRLPEAVDAGFSSDVANSALARIGKIALALSVQGESMAANIDATHGAYRAADDAAESDVRTTEQDLADIRERERTPLHEAPPEPGQEHKNQPEPTVETAPAPKPPPPTGGHQ